MPTYMTNVGTGECQIWDARLDCFRSMTDQEESRREELMQRANGRREQIRQVIVDLDNGARKSGERWTFDLNRVVE
jgi:hypothetical protein